MKSLPLLVALTATLLFQTKPAHAGELPKELAMKYTSFALTTDTSVLSPNQKKMLPLLIQVADIMNEIFWIQAYGDKDPLLKKIDDEQLRRFTRINYGPWDRLGGNKPFVKGAGEKPKGANFYPADVTKAEVSAADAEVRGLYTMVRRDEQGKLKAIPYHVFFKKQVTRAAELLRQAAALAETLRDLGFDDVAVPTPGDRVVLG